MTCSETRIAFLSVSAFLLLTPQAISTITVTWELELSQLGKVNRDLVLWTGGGWELASFGTPVFLPLSLSLLTQSQVGIRVCFSPEILQSDPTLPASPSTYHLIQKLSCHVQRGSCHKGLEP